VFKRRKADEMPAADHENLRSQADSQPPVSHPGAVRLTDQFGGSARTADSGLGVPPFRPAQPKEAPAMGRAPFAPSPAPVPQPPMSNAMAPRPAMLPPGRSPAREPAERRMLVVGRGISLQGTVQDAERLVVEGTVEASMIHATELSISPGGVFKGEIEVEEAEVAGTIDGTLTARASLIVRATGRVLGTARCRRLQVEDGGQITGRIEMLSDAPRTADMRAEATA
jgi:cytoskeletal protein CcmA (bactofilin family)